MHALCVDGRAVECNKLQAPRLSHSCFEASSKKPYRRTKNVLAEQYYVSYSMCCIV